MKNAYRLKRTDIFLDKKLRFGESGTNLFVRLAKKDSGTWSRPIHETWEVSGSIGTLSSPIKHYAANSIGQFVSKLDYYTTINAQHLYDQGVHASYFHIICYPPGKFLVNYMIKGGILDGTHGFVHAVFMSFHSFLTRAKLCLLWEKNKRT